ncbi:MAG: hypothetical protein JWP37_784 [Mucilaginibacter sp.]|nr:hypothetical protein [Mucilaginibacter sp.]
MGALLNKKTRLLNRVSHQKEAYFGFLVVSFLVFHEVSFFILCFLVVSCLIAGVAAATNVDNVNAESISAANSFFMFFRFKDVNQ